MSNRSVGNKFETELCDKLASNGFWAHCMKQSAAGQPADVICARNGEAWLIDCKVCEGTRFDFSRVEPNQYLAMRRWADTGNGSGWFAIKMKGEIYMLSMYDLERLENEGVKSLNWGDLTSVARLLGYWVWEVLQ